VRHTQLFLSLEHLKAIIEPLIGLISINMVVSQGTGRPKERERDGNGWSMEKSEHTQHLVIIFTISYEHDSWYPKTITIVTSEITDHRSPYKYKDEKV